ncbi:uridine diphosphate glucose pyrophosphatase NUDT22 [Stegastes partitus]|uniref:Nucleoside diphosphate-linked moiety X motif 22 n=1 Tax=Stegastes partitus TaxID=144197 RepID=A0A3B4ZSJ5_9TELE|nr:PREDICTED: nucleoside diphosphate-linked moiety X motif 22 [Stegastes partitus]XP_008302351.1 PREDICTED: nucleoside diphosphate-linked moiety X motif 22 [Stegastes partitus]XP_008302357.1 PREDICTED: nucleoside diphosphate-linked moiety X motif 22 [Stegastes partitus]XP_008302365.1 PREDICTED: nucleoside diphosphate-linked moiety X motif 22 [Stegastes partitus]
MDPEVSVLLHCERWQGLLQSQVQVELSERFNRQIDPAVELHIDELWTGRVSKEPWLFNGAKFRLHSFCFATQKQPPSTHSSNIPFLNCAEDQNRQTNSCINQTEPVADVIQQTDTKLLQDFSTCGCTEQKDATPELPSRCGPFLTLRLGLTCYKDYLGTNWSSQVAELRRRGEVEFGDPLALLAQPLGVGAVLRTADSQVVLIRRSQRVAEAGGFLDLPGGHPEPKVVCERLGQAVCEEDISVVMMQPEVVVSELFSSVCAEIRDEVNVPLSSLGEPVLLGVALNHTSAGRPSAEFYVSCSLTSDEVRKFYWKGGAEAHESTDVVFVSRTEVLQLDSSSPLWSELCPSAKGAVLLYQIVKPDGEPDDKSTIQNGPR